jgi:hypothetical protein
MLGFVQRPPVGVGPQMQVDVKQLSTKRSLRVSDLMRVSTKISLTFCTLSKSERPVRSVCGN